MQRLAARHSLLDRIDGMREACGLRDPCYGRMLEHTVDLFESRGMGSNYYGYHNIDHELEVTYVALMVCSYYMKEGQMDDYSVRHLFAAALLHDFDPEKSVDKPHEANVIRYISEDRALTDLLDAADIDVDVVKALILRTTYPWHDAPRAEAEAGMKKHLDMWEAGGGDRARRADVWESGWLLSVVDRVAGYSLGDFSKAMEMAKMNAHASAWHPALIVRRSVSYFDDLLNAEARMCHRVLRAVPSGMRKNFFDTVQAFLKLRQEEIKIQSEYAFGGLRLTPKIETAGSRSESGFAAKLLAIYDELPRPLQLTRDRFAETVADSTYVLNTLRLDGPAGEVIGFAKGGPLEAYDIRDKVRDENYGAGNTMFLEPIALKKGYWGLRGGSEMRHMIVMQASSMGFKYMTSFALRSVIEKRMSVEQGVELVTKFDPERWDYYRIAL